MCFGYPQTRVKIMPFRQSAVIIHSTDRHQPESPLPGYKRLPGRRGKEPPKQLPAVRRTGQKGRVGIILSIAPSICSAVNPVLLKMSVYIARADAIHPDVVPFLDEQ
jgi:hypothetical protein